MLVPGQFLVHLTQKDLIRHVANGGAGVVQRGQDARPRHLDQLADALVVEVVDLLPLDALPLVFLLLLFQDQLYEQLLQLLVAVVNT